MTASQRVLEARRRLRQSADSGDTDHALRIVEIESPRANGSPLRLHPNLNVISGMTAAAVSAIEQTIEALRRNDSASGLDGRALVDGVEVPLHGDRPLPPRGLPRGALFGRVPEELRLSSHEEARLRKLSDSLESAIGLAAAELRGADAALREIRTGDLAIPEVIDLRPDDVERAGIADALAEVESMAPDDAAISRIRDALARRTPDRHIQQLHAVAAQYVAAIDALQPSDSAAVRASLQASLDATRAEIVSLESETMGVDDLAAELDALGLVPEPNAVVETAERVVAEADELAAVSKRLRDKLEHPRAWGRTDNTPSPRSSALETRKAALQRRLQTLRKLRAAAHEQLAAQTASTSFLPEMPIGSSTGHTPDGRQLPVVVRDVSAHLPRTVRGDLDELLERLAAATQVIVLAEAGDLDATSATGWFAGQDD